MSFDNLDWSRSVKKWLPVFSSVRLCAALTVHIFEHRDEPFVYKILSKLLNDLIRDEPVPIREHYMDALPPGERSQPFKQTDVKLNADAALFCLNQAMKIARANKVDEIVHFLDKCMKEMVLPFCLPLMAENFDNSVDDDDKTQTGDDVYVPETPPSASSSSRKRSRSPSPSSDEPPEKKTCTAAAAAAPPFYRPGDTLRVGQHGTYFDVRVLEPDRVVAYLKEGKVREGLVCDSVGDEFIIVEKLEYTGEAQLSQPSLFEGEMIAVKKSDVVGFVTKH